jgi:hypothetical protein
MILQALSFAVLFIGHSLVSPDIPKMLTDIARVEKLGGKIDYQIINGAPLRVNWDDSSTAEGIDGRVALASGGYDVVIITESIPLKDQIEWNDTKGYALRWYELAVSANPKARVYMYETWHSRDSGADDTAWRKRLDQDLAAWEGIVDSVNSARKPGAPEMLVVPAGQGLARLHDEVAAGRVPELAAMSDLFSDDIHLNDVGKYFIAMIQYAAIYQKSPEGLPRALRGQWGPFKAPTQALATKMQQVAWEVVRGYARSGVGG